MVPRLRAGGIFDAYKPLVSTHVEITTHGVEIVRSENEPFDAGMHRSGIVRFDIAEPHGVGEFMHFLDGSVTLTSSDGTETEVSAGDSAVIPREWTGVGEAYASNRNFAGSAMRY